MNNFKRYSVGLPATFYYNRKRTNIFERDCDVLLILDACRVDDIESVSDKYSFIPGKVSHIKSVGAGSPGWMAKTFRKEWKSEMEKTSYLSANPHTKRVLGTSTDGLYADRGGTENNLEDFNTFIPLWQGYWDEDIGTVPARAVSDYLIQFSRNSRSERVIAHYMQPHFPSIPTQFGSGININNESRWESGNTWELISNGDITIEKSYDSYIKNLLYVLDEIKLVLRNINADVVISADHGNAFGEWNETSHGQPYIGAVRNVPWIQATANDSGTYMPKIEENLIKRENNNNIDEKLRALGYKS